MSSSGGKIKKGDVVTVQIGSLSDGGEGVSRDVHLGVPLFVSRTAPGDLVEVEVFDVRKDFARAKVRRIIEPAPVRCEPQCKLFKVCGGCQWQHLAYEQQLAAKTDIVRQAVVRIGRLPPDVVLPALGAREQFSYRNKVQFPTGFVAKTGRILAGYYEEGSHNLVNIKHCPVQPEPLDRLLASVKEAAARGHLSVYDEKTGEGLLRHIAARHSLDNNEILLTLVLNASPHLNRQLLEKLRLLANQVMSEVPEVKGVCVNFNRQRGNRIMAEETLTIAGKDAIEETLRSNLPEAPAALQAGVKYSLSSTSFFQVNTAQASVLLDQVLLAVTGNLRQMSIPLLVDAYAGVGTMAIFLSFVCQQVVAIEEWAQAVADGKRNLELNGVRNVELHCASTEQAAAALAARGMRPQAVVVDPPRKGLAKEAVSGILSLAAPRIVYVSCNPATLARDLRVLADAGYKTKQIQPIDMFPQTYHIESVTLLER